MGRKGIRSLGGGWFELPDGRKIRGRAAAEEAAGLAAVHPIASKKAKRETGRSRSKSRRRAASADDDALAVDEPPKAGLVADAVAGWVSTLDLGDVGSPRRTLAAVALTLAAHLDGGAGLAAAAVARELRETVRELEGTNGDASTFSQWSSTLGVPT